MIARRLVLGAALAATLAACGQRSAPIAPALVQPLPPTGLLAAVGPDGVKLTWKRPTRTSGGRRLDDLGRFLVERAVGDAGPFATVATIVVEDKERFQKQSVFEWTDADVAPGMRLGYRVVAVTLDDYHSPPAGPVVVEIPAAGAATPPAATPPRPAPR